MAGLRFPFHYMQHGKKLNFLTSVDCGCFQGKFLKIWFCQNVPSGSMSLRHESDMKEGE